MSVKKVPCTSIIPESGILRLLRSCYLCGFYLETLLLVFCPKISLLNLLTTWTCDAGRKWIELLTTVWNFFKINISYLKKSIFVRFRLKYCRKWMFQFTRMSRFGQGLSKVQQKGNSLVKLSHILRILRKSDHMTIHTSQTYRSLVQMWSKNTTQSWATPDMSKGHIIEK